MSDAAFDSTISGIFARMEKRLGGRLAAERAKTENLQSQDTRRVAFILSEAIEAELEPAVKEALAAYNDAINRPMLPNERWEQILLHKIEHAVEGAVKLALAVDGQSHPWKPLLSAEMPKLRSRFTDTAEQHFAGLGKVSGRRGPGARAIPDWVLWLAIFAVGAGFGLVVARLIG